MKNTNKYLILFLIVLFSLQLAGCTKTTLPVNMPNDFSFSIHWDYYGYYDSVTKELKYGYNNDLDKECKTTLMLTNKQLSEIYTLLRNVEIDTIPEKITVSEDLVVPNFTLLIKYTVNNVERCVYVEGATMVNADEWSCYNEFGYAFEKIVRDYIENSKEFKTLPPNQFFVD